MSSSHVGHSELLAFARERVNLPKDKADEYRDQAGRLQDKLKKYLDEHPDFELRRLMLSGSIAKGTALRSLNDIDVGAYIVGPDTYSDVAALLEYLTAKLRTAFPNFQPDQIQPQRYSVRVSFRGSGLDVDIVPILYSGDPDWRGHLVSQEDGSLLETSIPRHLDFCAKRKRVQPTHFAQVARLIKYWVRYQKSERTEFRFKSFLIELVLSHISDRGESLSDYPSALQAFFTYVASSALRERIAFTDYYAATTIPAMTDPVQIIDPVNAENNAARLYSSRDAELMAEAALEAGDSIDSAHYAPTKTLARRYWKQVFGPTFNA